MYDLITKRLSESLCTTLNLVQPMLLIIVVSLPVGRQSALWELATYSHVISGWSCKRS